MPEVLIEVSEVGFLRRGPGLRTVLIDFANMLKAFIGSNYLTIAFAFNQSGVVMGIVCLLIIASLTAHCCHLLVKCKYHAIQSILLVHQKLLNDLDDSESHESFNNGRDYDNSKNSTFINKSALQEKMENSLNYGDLGQLCLGRLGVTMVNAAVMLTQFGFCVGYCVLIGNTLMAMFPLYNCTIPAVNISGDSDNVSCVKILDLMTSEVDYTGFSQEHELGVNDGNSAPKRLDDFASDVKFVSSGHLLPSLNSTTILSTFLPSAYSRITSASLTLDLLASKDSNIPSQTMVNSFEHIVTSIQQPASSTISHNVLMHAKWVPDLKLLILIPLPILISLNFIQSIRGLGIISAIANLAIFIGCIEVLTFLIIGFKLDNTFEWYKWKELPVFFGMVTSAYEGIGTILPIESSMEGNRHNFVPFLYGAVAVLTLVLASFGILGYLKFGTNVEQMINANIPHGGTLSLAVNVCLCVGILLTFPLMMYPVVDLAELYIFGDGHICGPSRKKEETSGDRQALLPQQKIVTGLQPVTAKVSDKVPIWKRNCLRVLVVLLASGLAVLLRHNFAYISAFVGALGSTLLAYILPCIFHLKICWQFLPLSIKMKDIAIIFIGLFCSVAGLYSVLLQIKQNFDA